MVVQAWRRLFLSGRKTYDSPDPARHRCHRRQSVIRPAGARSAVVLPGRAARRFRHGRHRLRGAGTASRLEYRARPTGPGVRRWPVRHVAGQPRPRAARRSPRAQEGIAAQSDDHRHWHPGLRLRRFADLAGDVAFPYWHRHRRGSAEQHHVVFGVLAGASADAVGHAEQFRFHPRPGHGRLARRRVAAVDRLAGFAVAGRLGAVAVVAGSGPGTAGIHILHGGPSGLCRQAARGARADRRTPRLACGTPGRRRCNAGGRLRRLRSCSAMDTGCAL